MAFSYHIVASGLVVIVYADPVTFARWAATMDAIFADPAYHPGCVFLGDGRTLVDAPNRTYAESVVNYFSTHRGQLEGGRWAELVAPGNAAAYGMSRMIGILAALEGVLEVRSFTDEASASTWLGP